MMAFAWHTEISSARSILPTPWPTQSWRTSIESSTVDRSRFERASSSSLKDHGEDNLWVLRDVHHRAKFFGIHEVTFPI